MFRFIPIILFFFLSFDSSGQVSGYIRSASSQSPIPFATISIFKKHFGVSSDSSGFFYLDLVDYVKDPEDSFLISSIGFRDTLISVNDIDIENWTIFLREEPMMLHPVTILANKSSKSFEISKINKRKSRWYISPKHNTTKVYAIFYPFEKSFRDMRISKVKVLIVENDYKFNPVLRIVIANGYDRKDYGAKFIYSKNQVINSSLNKKNRIIEIEIEEVIRIAEEGILIGVENYLMPKGCKYGPPVIRGIEGESGWTFDSGIWEPFNILPSIEIVLEYN